MITLEMAIAEKLPKDFINNIREHGEAMEIWDIGTAVIAVYADGFTEIRKKTGGPQ